MSLSPRELEVVQLYANGYTVKRIAAKLNIADSTVSLYTKIARQKLATNTITHAVAEAFRKGLIK